MTGAPTGHVSVVLVEGRSDRAALHALADRRGRDLESEGVSVVVMGGITNLHHHLQINLGSDKSVLGMYDAGEEWIVAQAFERIGLGGRRSRDDLERLGFYVCVEDLEDELLRALGPDAAIEFIESQGELPTFRRMQSQPAWRGRPVEDQLRRFCGIRSGRKERYGRGLVESLDADRIPRPLEAILDLA